MIMNKILLLEESITIFDVVGCDLELILMWAKEMGRKTQLILDDGIYTAVNVRGTEKILYAFMQCVFRQLSGIVR